MVDGHISSSFFPRTLWLLLFLSLGRSALGWCIVTFWGVRCRRERERMNFWSRSFSQIVPNWPRYLLILQRITSKHFIGFRQWSAFVCVLLTINRPGPPTTLIVFKRASSKYPAVDSLRPSVCGEEIERQQVVSKPSDSTFPLLYRSPSPPPPTYSIQTQIGRKRGKSRKKGRKKNDEPCD